MAWRQTLFGLAHIIRQAVFWEWLAGIALIVLLVGAFAWFAAGHDAYLRLKPVVCAEGMADRQFLIVAMASPIAVLMMLAAIGEFWQQRDARRSGRPMRWLYLSLFSGSALGLIALILAALRC